MNYKLRITNYELLVINLIDDYRVVMTSIADANCVGHTLRLPKL